MFSWPDAIIQNGYGDLAKSQAFQGFRLLVRSANSFLHPNLSQAQYESHVSTLVDAFHMTTSLQPPMSLPGCVLHNAPLPAPSCASLQHPSYCHTSHPDILSSHRDPQLTPGQGGHAAGSTTYTWPWNHKLLANLPVWHLVRAFI